MRVTVREDCRVYFNYGVWGLAAGQQLDGEFADYLYSTGAPVDELSDVTGDVTGDGVPDGTAKEVLDWVDGDKAKAAQAITAEQAREKPRSTLLADLERMTAADGE